MAKSGQVQLLDGLAPGDEPLADSVVFTESTPTSLGGVVADLLEKSADPLKIVVDTLNRKVYAFTAATDVVAMLGGSQLVVGNVTRDDATKRSSPVTMAAGDDISASPTLLALKTEIEGGFAAAKPSKNVASIVNAAEDAAAAIATAHPITPGALLVLVDQTGDGTVTVFGNVNSFTPAGAVAEIKQVPQTTTTVTPLAFE